MHLHSLPRGPLTHAAAQGSCGVVHPKLRLPIGQAGGRGAEPRVSSQGTSIKAPPQARQGQKHAGQATGACHRQESAGETSKLPFLNRTERIESLKALRAVWLRLCHILPTTPKLHSPFH